MTPGGWEDARDVPVTAGRRGTEDADKRLGEWGSAGLCSRESRALAKGRRGRQGGGRCSGRAWNGGGRDLLWRGGWWNRALVETRGCSSKQLPVGERRVKETEGEGRGREKVDTVERQYSLNCYVHAWKFEDFKY